MINEQKTSMQPFHVLANPAGPLCNLACDYCFYLEKTALFPDAGSFRMGEETLEAFVRQYFESQPPECGEVNLAWQGGEPLLRGIDFFRQAVRLAQQYARPGQRVNHSLQTNGLLLDDEWCRLLKEHNFLVGISIDGPAAMHDKHRRDRKGAATFARTMLGLDALKRHQVDFNVLTVVNADNGDHAQAVYDFLKQMGAEHLQFIPLVEKDAEGALTAQSVGGEQYGRFLCGIFDQWLAQNDVGYLFIRDFEVMLNSLMGNPPALCVHAETCGRSLAIEHNGDIFSCDHFTFSEYRLGNLHEADLASLVDGAQQKAFGESKRDNLPRRCLDCEYLELCNGGCPKDRLAQPPDGEPGLNHLCPGYRLFFRHASPTLLKMAKCLHCGRPAADYRLIDRKTTEEPVPPASSPNSAQLGRNDPCPCGSGQKYKKCCLRR